MPGIAVGVGEGEEKSDSALKPSPLAEEIRSSSPQNGFSVTLAQHPKRAEDSPGVRNDVTVWVWGRIKGTFEDGGYLSRLDDGRSTSQFVADEYATHGIDRIQDFNGDFVVVVHDEAEEVLYVATDRLSKRPVYVHLDDDQVLATTTMQALPEVAGVPAAFDDSYLPYYFQFRRMLGRRVPLEGIERVGPASILSIDLNNLTTNRRQYWMPEYDPASKSYDAFVDEFINLFKEVVSELAADEIDYGLAISGGADSRLAALVYDEPTTCFTSAHWMSNEARVAETAALLAGHQFRIFHPGEHSEQHLHTNSAVQSFNDDYYAGRLTPFVDEIRSDREGLIGTWYADELFEEDFLPVAKAPVIRGLRQSEAPIEDPEDIVDRYVDTAVINTTDPLPYQSGNEATRRRMLSEIEAKEDGVEFFGVKYPSLQECFYFRETFPLTYNQGAHDAMFQSLPYQNPFIDDRIVEFHLRYPIKYRLRRKLQHSAITRLDDRLGQLESVEPGLPIKRSTHVWQYKLGRHYRAYRENLLPSFSGPLPYMKGGHDSRKYIQDNDTFGSIIEDNESQIRAAPFLNWNAVKRCYRRHREGTADNTAAIYGLVKLLEMPVFQLIYHE